MEILNSKKYQLKALQGKGEKRNNFQTRKEILEESLKNSGNLFREFNLD